MTTVPINNEIKTFLEDFPYEVMHENDNTNQYEYYFVVMSLEDTRKTVSSYMNDVLNNYIQDYPLDMLSPQTLKFMSNNKMRYHFVFIDKISLDDPFFKQKELFIKENANNILSKRMIGVLVDPALNFSNNVEQYLGSFKDISLSLGKLAKIKAQEKLNQGKNILDEKTPMLKDNISKNIKNIGNTLGNTLKKFKK